MPTEAEIRVMEILSAIEVPRNAGEMIEAMGNEAVTVVCEAALGSYPGLREKVRTNAVAVLGTIDHQQAEESIALLVADTKPDVAVRAMRSAGIQKNAAAVSRLDEVLQRSESTPVLAAEAVKALRAIATPKARQSLERYQTAEGSMPAHRRSALVEDILSQLQP